MNSIVAKTPNVAEIIKHNYFKKTEAFVEIDYVLQSISRLYIHKNQWVGNCIVNPDGKNLRYSEICDSKQEGLFIELIKQKAISEDEIVEISCIAFSKNISDVKRFRIYFNAIYDAISTKKKYIIGGSVNPKIIKRFKLVLPHELATVGGIEVKGHNEAETLYMVYGESKGLIWRFIRVLPKVLYRSIKRRFLQNDVK